jgi:radical SAM superfamily enzyme YgiQ (UPF0313 family)
MKVLLVQPKPPPSFWTCSEAAGITDCAAYMQNIALPTLAALAPSDVEVTIIDDASEAIPYDDAWDLVGITGYITHRARMVAIADEFRRRGRLVAIGGPYASLSPEAVRAHADILFRGEAEETWPAFLRDFRAGRWRSEYHAPAAIDLQLSPLPAIDKLRPRYVMGVVQTSRGCPFECEFCDVIVYLGRKQRHKQPEHVVAELDRLYQAGYRHVFLADDNFTVNRKRCADIMRAVRTWSQDLPEPMIFTTQLSIDVARDADTELLDLCAAAGLREAFIGIETPDHDALREVKKRQNLRNDLVADVHRIQSRGIAVWAGMISGFDADTRDSFVRQYEFLQRSGVLIAALSLLAAPEGTPLAKRLHEEGRLLPETSDLFIDTNIVPKSMTREELLTGARWLWNRVYAPEAFLARIAVFAEHAPPKTRQMREVAPVAAFYWQRVFNEYERMGPEFRTVPRRAVKIFRGKDSSVLGGALTFYNHVVGLLRRWGVWDRRLAELPEPPFDRPAAFDPNPAAAQAAH